ncbi:MAG: SGNH/GDSL hydrolase family protein [Lachnospiraceae bacterium]|nr:SGNH/GDSL hydrolase family protein [Lachnospiraceae bacterium]
MKKANFIFLGECIVITALLLLIGSLIRTDERYVYGKETEAASSKEQIEEPFTDGGQVQYARDLLNEQKNTVSGNETVSDNGLAPEKTVSENELNPEETVSDNDISGEDGQLRIAVFGDSIWDDKRGEDGISERLEEMLQAEVYNCAIGGTSAAVVSSPTDLREGWNSKSVNGLMYVAREEESSSLLEGLPAKEEIEAVDFTTVDYLIISYGLNDYFSGVEIYPEDMYDMTSYVGAIRHAVAKMTETYPNLEVLIIGPTYTNLTTELSEGDLEDYVEAAKLVSEEYETAFLDAYHELGIQEENQKHYLYDRVHLSAEGRALYAEYVSNKLIELESEKAE